MFIKIALFAYIIDRVFGEFKFVKHPVVLMGEYIKWFEKKYYQNSIASGVGLTVSLIAIVFIVSYILELILPWYCQAVIASAGIASKMLYESVKDIIKNPKNIRYLVSRDTADLSRSDINKAAVETYAENLSDGVIAPLFYLLFFGLSGLWVYKAVNTLDSMVGYRNTKYELFGKFSARLDDILNFIPSRICAFLISLLFWSKKSFNAIFDFGYKHESVNAGYPISAMAAALDVSLGGATSYFGKIKQKPYFGDGKKSISIDDIKKALSLQIRLDIFIVVILGVLYGIY